MQYFMGGAKGHTLHNVSYPDPTLPAIQDVLIFSSSAHQAGSHFLARQALDALDAGAESGLFQGDHLIFRLRLRLGKEWE